MEHFLWHKIDIPYDGNWRKHLEIEKFLESNADAKDYKIFNQTHYKQPRKQHAHKVVCNYTYYIKNPSISSWLALKWQ